MQVPLRAIAHARSGDKGHTCNIAVIVYDPVFFPFVRDQLSSEKLLEHFAGRIDGPVERLGVINYVARNALGGGVSRTLNLDQLGKSFSAALLGFELEIPDRLANHLRGHM